MATQISDYRSHILLHAPTASNILADVAIYNAMQYVAKQSKAMRVTTEVTFVDGTPTYSLPLTNSRAIDINKLYYITTTNGNVTDEQRTPLDKATQSQMVVDLIDSNRTAAQPQSFALLANNVVQVYPFNIPLANVTDKLRAEVIVYPYFTTDTPSATHEFTEHFGFFTKNEEIIKERAIYNMLSMPGKKWTSLTQANLHFNQAERMLAEAKSLAPDGGVQNVRRSVRYGGY
jgi:hypothetical protein